MNYLKALFASLVLLCFVRGSFATVFHIDPALGSGTGDGSIAMPWQTLEEVVNSNLIESWKYFTPYDPDAPVLLEKNMGAPVKAGDTLLVYEGLHGELFIENYINTDYITILAKAGENPILKTAHFRGAKKWILDGVTVSSEPYGVYLNTKCVFLESHNWQGPVSQIEIKNCSIESASTPWTTATDWINKASDGIIIKGDSIEILQNSITNIHFGVSMLGDYIRVVGNTIKNFSADGIRLVGSYSLIESNLIKNCYDVDENHDDGIQSFTTGGLVVDNNTIRKNTILNYEDPDQPLLGALQGIGCFDGPFHNWVIENNLISVDHWHGISLYGAINCHIINNTVIDPTPDVTPGPSWIKIEDLAGFPAMDCVVKNNVSNSVAVTVSTTTGNNTALSTYTDYSTNFVDYATQDFHLLETSVLVDNADATVAPTTDLDGNERPSGANPDIGAYEYMYGLGIEKDYANELKIYPNPFLNDLQIDAEINFAAIKIIDLTGRLIRTFTEQKLPASVDLSFLEKGTYILYVRNIETNEVYKQTIVKN